MKYDKNYFRGKRIVCVPALIVGMLLTSAIAGWSAWTDVLQGKQAALQAAQIYSVRSEQLLYRLFHKTDIIKALIIAGKGRLDEETFQNVSQSLADGVGIRALQYLPGGVVTYCYPVAGNEAAIGGSVFKNPKRRQDALLAVKTQNISLSGPYSLTQGGLGLVARNPIFLNNAASQERFWGFSVIILDLPDALEPLLLSELGRAGYAYRLHCITDEGTEMTIAEDGTAPAQDWVNYEISVPNHTWTLSLAPEHGWIDRRKVLIIIFVGLFTSLLAAIVIREKLERERILHYFAVTDELTSLFNRRWLGEVMETRCQNKQPFTLFYMDLNKFKEINDTLGHDWGDMVLKETAQRIRAAVGVKAILARIGGDEFVAVLDGKSQMAQVTESIEKHMLQPFEREGETRTLSISIGWALFPNEGRSYDELIKIADRRMYERKRAGK